MKCDKISHLLVLHIGAAEVTSPMYMVKSSIECEVIADIQKEAPISQKIYNQRNNIRYGALQFSIFSHFIFSGEIVTPYTK